MPTKVDSVEKPEHELRCRVVLPYADATRVGRGTLPSAGKAVQLDINLAIQGFCLLIFCLSHDVLADGVSGPSPRVTTVTRQ